MSSYGTYYGAGGDGDPGFYNNTGNVTNLTFVHYHNYPANGPPPVSAFFLSFSNFIYFADLFVVSFGVIGNIISFYIFTKTKLRKVSSSLYFSAIAFVDMGYLLSYMCTNLTSFKVDLLHVHGFCPLLMYINHICTFLSIWYVAALVTEKFIGIYWPSKKSRFCTVFRAKCVIISFLILAIVCYHYITWTIGYNSAVMICVPWSEDELMGTWMKLNKIDQMVVSVFPYLVIVFLSCLIAFRTWQFYKRNRSTGYRLHRRQTAFVPNDKEYKTSGLLLIIAFVTFSLGIINSLTRVFRTDIPRDVSMVGSFLQTNSYSIKPYIYVLASRAYRKEIWRIAKRLFVCERNSSLSEMQTVSQQTDNGRAIEIVIEKAM